MEVTQATEYKVIHFKPNDTRPFINRFNSHDEAMAFANDILGESDHCAILTVNTRRELLK